MSNTGRSLKVSNQPEQKLGALTIVRPAELVEQNILGAVAFGIFEGAVKKPAGVTKNGKSYKASTEYRIRGANPNPRLVQLTAEAGRGDASQSDTLTILNETKALKDQLGQLAADGSDNAKVEIIYNGKIATKSGNDFHDFEVFVK